MTRHEQVRAAATDLKIRARVFALKRLALDSASAFERCNDELAKELRKLIDGHKPNSNVQ